MAAFSLQHPAFVLDSFFVSSTSNTLSSIIEEGTIATKTCFSTMLPNEYLQEIPLHAQIHETSPLHPQVPFSCTSTDPCLTAEHNSVLPPTLVELASGDQATQVVNPVEKKRKNMEVKVERESKGEKERKFSGSLRKGEQRRIKSDSKKQKKVAEKAPSDFVRVRARRGQATDSHSLAERVRRGKISERMKILQSLVPGCDKVTGKALILDEIIQYVQTLQTQVEYLAANLASVSSICNDWEMDFNTYTLGQEDNGNLLWSTAGSPRHGLANHNGLDNLSCF